MKCEIAVGAKSELIIPRKFKRVGKIEDAVSGLAPFGEPEHTDCRPASPGKKFAAGEPSMLPQGRFWKSWMPSQCRSQPRWLQDVLTESGTSEPLCCCMSEMVKKSWLMRNTRTTTSMWP